VRSSGWRAEINWILSAAFLWPFLTVSMALGAVLYVQWLVIFLKRREV
jgi:hypothetical protein